MSEPIVLPRPSHAPRVARGALRVVFRTVVVGYAALILGFVWVTKDMTVASLREDPLFAGYSIAVVLYVLGRFVASGLYRSTPDVGHRPSVSIIVPAFNEMDGILSTIDSCIAVDYPPELLEVIVINDGSTDATWDNILQAKLRHPQILAVDLGRNYGKRAAMAEGVRRSTGEVLCFVDSDSYLAPDAVVSLVQPFVDERVGAVVGHAEVRNAGHNWLTKMQQVRYYSAFRVIKGTESLFSGSVTCASGCCAAYRAELVRELLPAWETQRFLGRPATFGDDRALTNRVLRKHRVVYQRSARAETVVPDEPRRFFRQQLRWKKSWLRESLAVVRIFWRKNPLAALFTYASIVFPFLAPWVVLHAVLGRVGGNATGGLWFYLIGSYAMALLYSLYYAVQRNDGLWFHGMTFVGLYMSVLVFQTYWGIFTMRDTCSGNARLDHRTPPRRPSARHGALTRRLMHRSIRQLVIGLVALPLSLLPFAAYFTMTPEGRLIRDRVLVAVNPPTLPSVSDVDVARGIVPAYEGAVMVLAYHGIGATADGEGGFVVSPARFGEHLVALRRAGMHTVTAGEVADAFSGGRPLPPRALMLTFDDGRNDAMMFADPLLEEAGMKATMFVVASKAESPGLYYAGWGRLEEAARSGRWDLQSHTFDQHRVRRVDGQTLPALTSLADDESIGEYRHRIRDDLTRASRAIAERSGARPVAIAYPFGAYGADRVNDARIPSVLREEVGRRYQLGFQQDDQQTIPLATAFDERTSLRRLEVGDWSAEALMRRIAASAARHRRRGRPTPGRSGRSDQRRQFVAARCD